jgi:integrase
MARTVENPKITSRSARAKLPTRGEPFWTVISAGNAIGYRKGAKGGTWIARLRDDSGKQHYESLGAADDARDADALSVFDFAQAQGLARTFFAKKTKELRGEVTSGPYTVEDALRDYFKERFSKGSKGAKADEYSANARIIPALGSIRVDKITTPQIRDWHRNLAKAPKLLRTKKAATERATAKPEEKGDNPERARKPTANRILTILKAALNHAFHEGKTADDSAWRKVKPFKSADAPVVRYLKADESVRLINACDPDFRQLVHGALVTACRYGELVRMTVNDFDRDAKTVFVAEAKSEKPRHVALNDEGARFFEQITAGRLGDERIFIRDDGEPWGASHQRRRLIEASERASIRPAATFHVLRHTYASALAMRGVPLTVIAKQLGHADTRITERHYAHLCPNYVAETVRAALPSLGLPEESNVVSLVRAR